MINSIPSEFDFLSNINKKVTIKEGKICFPYDSAFVYWLASFNVFILPAVILVIYAGFFQNSSLEAHKKFTDLLYIYCFVLAVFWTMISNSLKFYSVIDFHEKCFYKEIKVLFTEFKYQIINLKEIKYITNNCIPVNNMFSPCGINKYGYYEGKKAEMNSKTDRFHKYYVSFLLKNGKLINFIELGIFERDYFTSIKLADTLANFWYIPLFKCKDYCTLKVINYNPNDVSCIEEEIKPLNEWLIFLYVITAMFLAFFVPVSISYLLYG